VNKNMVITVYTLKKSERRCRSADACSARGEGGGGPSNSSSSSDGGSGGDGAVCIAERTLSAWRGMKT
jgi:hypothetical protein